MRRDHKRHVKRFIHLKKAWYAMSALKEAKFVDEVSFGLYVPKDGTSGEMAMRWYVIDDKAPAPKLEVFDDAFSALARFRKVIDKLAEVDSDRITPEAFSNILKACGFEETIPGLPKHLKD